MGVRDVERSAKWYTEVLGLTTSRRVWGVCRPLSEKEYRIALFPASQEAKPSGHREFECFTSPSRGPQKFLAAQRELEKRGINSNPGSRDFALLYFHDPDGHNSRSRLRAR